MNSEIISVGTEILLGDILDTNAEYIAKQFSDLGINCYYQTVVGDNPNRLKDTIARAIDRSNIVILTGGLGPTYDDMTKEVVADVLGLELVYHPEIYEKIEMYFKKSDRAMTSNNKKQAYAPSGATILENYNGTAPGILIEQDNKTVILLPGPPFEMKAMFERYIYPHFAQKSNSIIYSHRVYLFGIGESQVEEILHTQMKNYTNPTIAPYASKHGLHLRVTASAKTKDEADKLMTPVIKEIYTIFKEYIYSIDIESLEETLVKKLLEKNLVLASAESCTAGYITKRLTDIPGSSEVFHLGVVSYSDDIKHRILNVSKETLEKHGAVSEETVKEMAKGVLDLSKSEIAVAISGIAGPGGGTKEKPVGLIYIAVLYEDKYHTMELNLSRGYENERQRIRYQSVSYALKMVLDIIS